LNINVERQPNLLKKKEKNLKKSFFLPKNSARSWAAIEKWSFEYLGVNLQITLSLFWPKQTSRFFAVWSLFEYIPKKFVS